MKYILFAGNEVTGYNDIRDSLKKDYKVDIASDKESCMRMFKKRRYDFTFIDINFLQDSNGIASIDSYQKGLQTFFHIFSNAEIAVLAPKKMIRDAVAIVKGGASFYLTYPLDTEEIKFAIEGTNEAVKMQLELDYLRDQFWKDDFFDIIHTHSPKMKDVFEKVKSVAPTRTTVLLTGETGTGKGVIAKLIHQHSHRGESPFIAVHCGAMPETLLESELFGHEKGSFTGATRRKLGKFEIAQGGTLLLDEVGTMTYAAQIKLLQILQDKIFQRVGGEETIECDVRIIAASNIDLKKMSEDGNFRKDLYYRLSVFPIEIPPLRERVEDISSLVNTFLQRLNKFHLKGIQGIHKEAIEAFERYPWPGNIRELENLIERAYILETSSILTPESFPNELLTYDAPEAPISLDISLSLAEVRNRGIASIERQYLKELLANNKGSINKTAEASGISTRQLHKLMVRHKIRKEEFKSFSTGS